MTNIAEETNKKVRDGLLSEGNLAQVRIYSGIVLFIYVVLHLINHSLGLISDQLMRDMSWYMKRFIHFPPVSLVLYGSLFLHVAFSFWRFYQRRTLRLPAKDWIQLISGIAIPVFLVSHVMGTRYAAEAYGIVASYDYVLLSVFVFSPSNAWMNAFGLIAAWLHGCFGMYMWLRLKPGFTPRLQNILLVLATLLPTISLAGYLSAGRRIMPLAYDGEFMGAYYEKLNLSSDAVWGFIANDTDNAKIAFICLIILVIGARSARFLTSRKHKNITIDYLDGPRISTPLGGTLLDMSKRGDVPHASVCGGRGRCSTCRIRILTANPDLDPPTEAEKRVLSRVRAGNDVRLACQLKPRSDLQIMRLMPSDVSRSNAADHEPWSSGQEKVVTVMFADLRDFTKTSENRLPFDVVYLINQFSREMGKVVEHNNGRIDKFLGDGFMALFGVEESAQESAQNALVAAGAMIEQLENLNQKLASDLAEPLRMGIGLHTGSVILGNMGYGTSRGLTAIGDTVNTASRLETATKEQKCVLCVSSQTMQIANMSAPAETLKKISIRGKSNKQEIHALQDTLGLEISLETENE